MEMQKEVEREQEKQERKKDKGSQQSFRMIQQIRIQECLTTNCEHYLLASITPS